MPSFSYWGGGNVQGVLVEGIIANGHLILIVLIEYAPLARCGLFVLAPMHRMEIGIRILVYSSTNSTRSKFGAQLCESCMHIHMSENQAPLLKSTITVYAYLGLATSIKVQQYLRCDVKHQDPRWIALKQKARPVSTLNFLLLPSSFLSLLSRLEGILQLKS